MAYPQTSFTRTSVPPTSLVGRRREAVSANTLIYQLEVLKKTGRYEAFRLKWHPTYNDEPEVWPIPNHLFWDSDVAKWIEGACYFLQQQKLPEVDAAVRELVDMIRGAQQDDGYLNIHYTVVEPGKRFTNLRDMHELYNAGHLVEAALAHQDCYGNDLLMDPVLKYVDLFCATFGAGEGKIPGYPGHPEIELALLRLYDRTRDEKHLKLAQFFLTERGNSTGMDGRHYYDVEAEKRGDDPAKRPAFYPQARSLWYHQAHAPIADQQTIEGHSVRAMYLLTAVSDLLRLTKGSHDDNLSTALYRLWDNMVEKKMYVTGGIGAIKQWEGFGLNYFLPQSTDEGGCYSETCAAIGVMMLAERLLQNDLDGRFADIMELCLYNAVLTSMSHNGKQFTYVNQLASSNTDPSKREEWFTVACCPPNVLRLLGQIGGYIWNSRICDQENSVDVRVHLYVPSTLALRVGQKHVNIQQESNWPWDGQVNFNIDSSVNTTLQLRIPEWATDFKITPECSVAAKKRGYLLLPPEWVAENRTFSLTIPLKPRWITQSPLTHQNTLSLAKGPVIYCLEDHDNLWVQDHFANLMVDPQASIDENHVTDKTSGDTFVGLTVKNGGYIADATIFKRSPFANVNDLEGLVKKSEVIEALHFIPYYFRANRGGLGQMRVGVQRHSGVKA